MKRFPSLALLSLGLLAACGPGTPAPDYSIRVIPAEGNQAAVAVPPPCPRWSDDDLDFVDNQPMPQFGCADARNLAVMVERPEDLLQGRPIGPASGVLAAGAVTRYENNQTRGLLGVSQSSDTSVDITTAPASASPLTGETPPASGGLSSSSGSSSSTSK